MPNEACDGIVERDFTFCVRQLHRLFLDRHFPSRQSMSGPSQANADTWPMPVEEDTWWVHEWLAVKWLCSY